MRFSILLTLSVFASVLGLAADNVAHPDRHPYAKPAGGRENVRLGSESLNQTRLYNFYERQADYYLENPDQLPEVLPAGPGLDSGLHGHWGKFNNNGFKSDVWSKMDIGRIVTMYGGLAKDRKVRLPRAVAVRMDGDLCAYFDPETRSYPALWRGRFLDIPTARFGIVHGFTPGEEPIITTALGNGKRAGQRSGFRYKGYYRNGDTAVFSYEIGAMAVLETPESIVWDDHDIFCRTLSFAGHTAESKWSTHIAVLPGKALNIQALQAKGPVRIWQLTDGKSHHIVGFRSADKTVVDLSLTKQGELLLEAKGSLPALARLYYTKATQGALASVLAKLKADTIAITPKQRSIDYPTMWPQTITLKGVVGENRFPYVVDDLPVPFENPWNSVMFMSGVDFLSNGAALACTLTGEVWYVTGLDKNLESVTWKRFATGLDKPFGMKVIDDQIYVGCHSQIVRLHDLNGDQEADFYETFDSRFKPSGDHSKSFGLDADKDGNFYVYGSNRSYKLPADPSQPAILMSDGTRSAMGFGASPDGTLLIAPQEGNWTPASMLIKAQPNMHYGFNTRDGNIAPPLCFIPRTIDNSTGGMVWVDSARWGPLRDQFVGLSYGNGSMYSILMDKNPAHEQAAIVPLPVEFRSGVVRGRINPADGQFYCAGTDGWGNYSLDPGCLSRVRYTGKPYDHPLSFAVFRNGVRLDFDVALAVETSLKTAKAFCQQWNYEYSGGYGSPEYSIRQPQQLGHDRVDVSALHLSKDGKSVFVEMPAMVPSMQLHIRLHLSTADGRPIRPSLYTTINKMTGSYSFSGQQKIAAGNAQQLALRSAKKESAGDITVSGAAQSGELLVRIYARGDVLAFDPPHFTVPAGKPIRLIFDNKSRTMPHNLVIVQPGTMEAVGLASDQMAAQSDALKKHYVPAEKGVINASYLVQPGKKHELHFVAPKQTGDYPLICTFPGHWRLMKGSMTVR